MHIGLYHGPVLVSPVVIGRDGARTVVHPRPHRGIAQISQVVGLGPGGQGGVFHLHEVADVHIAAQMSPWAQPRKWPDGGILTYHDAGALSVYMRHGLHHGAPPNMRIGNHTMGADAYAVLQHHPALEHAVHVYFHVLPAHQFAAHIQARRVGQSNALRHQRRSVAQLISTLQFGQLRRAIHARHLHRIGNAVRAH